MTSLTKTLTGSFLWLTPMVASAGGPPTIFWEPASSVPVPTLSTYALVAVAVLLASVAARFLHRPHRHLALILFAGVTAASVTYYPESGAPPMTEQTGCEGGATLPRVLENTCDRPIQVRYAWGTCPLDDQGVCFVDSCVPDGGIIPPSGVERALDCAGGGT